MGRGFGIMFELFPILFGIVFILILGMFLATAVKGVGTWKKNNHSPRLDVSAVVVAKRTNVSHHHHGSSNSHHMSSSTWYYVTFQVESGDRMEFSVSGAEYGMLAEGDRGKLSFQGTRYLSFERE